MFFAIPVIFAGSITELAQKGGYILKKPTILSGNNVLGSGVSSMKFFAKLFGKKPEGAIPAKKSGNLPLPDEIFPLINNAGRVDFELLVALAQTNKARAVEAFLGVPVLAGAGVKPGMIRPKGQGQITQMFNANQSGSAVLEEVLQNAVYPLMKGPYALNPKGNIYTIGRVAKNDLVIPDYAISQLHAQIRLQEGQYILNDCSSTNGTKLNGKQLEPGEELVVKDMDRLDFGRYEFRFYKPKTFTDKLRRIEL